MNRKAIQIWKVNRMTNELNLSLFRVSLHIVQRPVFVKNFQIYLSNFNK